MSRRVGELWIALGVLHFLIVGASGAGVLGDILRDGYVGAVGGDYRRNAEFWLFVLGGPCILLGMALRWTQRRLGTVPESVGWASAIFFLAGALAVPTSGFWLGLGIAVYQIVVARRAAPANTAI